MKPDEPTTISLLRRADQKITELMNEGLKDFDITSRQYHVLEAVDTLDGPSQTDLVTATGIDRSTLASLMKRLKAKGLIQRRRSRDDARAYVVNLSPEGRRVLAGARPAIEEAEGWLVRKTGKLPLKESLARVVEQVGA